ncbi:tyrosine-type recombinase/integrase [Vibrio splendidus]
MEVTNKAKNKLVTNIEVYKRVPLLLEKHHSHQIAYIWKFGVSTGFRIGDLLAIKFDDISEDQTFVTIFNPRTRKTKKVLLAPEAIEIVNSIKKANPSSKYLFQSHRSRNVDKNKKRPLTRQAVSLAFREVGEILGIPLTPHMMRQVHMVQPLRRLQLTLSDQRFIEYYLTKR